MKQGKDQAVTVTELASWLALSPRRLQQLTKRGIIQKKARGLYPLKESVQSYLWFIRGGEDKPDLEDWRLGFAKIDLSSLGGKS